MDNEKVRGYVLNVFAVNDSIFIIRLSCHIANILALTRAKRMRAYFGKTYFRST